MARDGKKGMFFFFLKVILSLTLTTKLCDARPHHYKHIHKHQHKDMHKKADKTEEPRKLPVMVPVPEFLMSSRVVLSARIPPQPPAALALSAMKDDPTLHNSIQASSDGHRNTQVDEKKEQIEGNGNQNATHIRAKRSLVGKESGISMEEARYAEPVCRSRSQWVTKSTSTDIWGNMVYIEQSIDNGGQQVHQYFYETFCEGSDDGEGSKQPATCKGVDVKLYTSICRDQYSWAYAFVTNATGESGWSMVKIRTSCGCALIAKTPQQAFLNIISSSFV